MTIEQLETQAYLAGDTDKAALLARITDLELQLEELTMKTTLANLYIEYINDFLTIERFAEYLDVSVTQCRALVDLGREFHNERVSE